MRVPSRDEDAQATPSPSAAQGGLQLVTEQEVAVRYQVTIHSVRRWRREGRITFLKIGRQVLFRPRDLEQFEGSHEVVLKALLPGRRGNRVRGCATIPGRDTGNG